MREDGKDRTGDNDERASARLPRASAHLFSVAARLRRDAGVRSAVFAFVLSRALVLAIFLLSGAARTIPDPEFPGHYDISISAHRLPVAAVLRQEVMTADVNWYVGIAESGYERRAFNADAAHNWAFFPLSPLLLRLASRVTGEFALTGMALSHLFFLAALLLLHGTCRLFGLSEGDAGRCVFYVAFFPVSYFFSLPQTESLFLMLTVGSFYSAKRGHWWAAGALGALASATRVTGLLLLPALLLLYWQGRKGLRPWRADALAPLLVPAGLLSFMLYLRAVTGNALAFAGVQAAWGRRPDLFLKPLLEYLREPLLLASHWDLRVLNFAAATAVLACGVVLLKRREWALAAYALLSALVALSSGLLQSQSRYAMTVFPLFMLLATAGRRPCVDQLTRAVFAVLFALLTAMFAAHFTVALS